MSQASNKNIQTHCKTKEHSDARQLHFLGERQKLDIQTQIQSAASAWLNNWSFSNTPATITSLSVNQQLANVSAIHVDKSRDDCQLFLDDSQFDWQAVVFAQHADRLASIEDNIGNNKDHLSHNPSAKLLAKTLNKAKLSFSQTLFKCLTGKSVSEFESQPCDTLAIKIMPVGDSCISFTLTFEQQQLQLCLPLNAWYQQQLKTNESKTQMLTPIGSCIDSQQLHANVELSLGTHDLDILKDLSVGDVLTSNTSLDTLFAVKVNNVSVAKAFLGKSDQKKAVYLLPLAQQSE
ncbi:MAG: hypothetical protein COA42_13540 [Alteromonadaceae bacterium]|nr:MAG: hypothetical protein COA42_13540 [Alteromonadaceae bacterium]